MVTMMMAITIMIIIMNMMKMKMMMMMMMMMTMMMMLLLLMAALVQKALSSNTSAHCKRLRRVETYRSFDQHTNAFIVSLNFRNAKTASET